MNVARSLCSNWASCLQGRLRLWCCRRFQWWFHGCMMAWLLLYHVHKCRVEILPVSDLKTTLFPRFTLTHVCVIVIVKSIMNRTSCTITVLYIMNNLTEAWRLFSETAELLLKLLDFACLVFTQADVINAGVGRAFTRVCMYVCLFDCPRFKRKTAWAISAPNYWYTYSSIPSSLLSGVTQGSVVDPILYRLSNRSCSFCFRLIDGMELHSHLYAHADDTHIIRILRYWAWPDAAQPSSRAFQLVSSARSILL